MKTKFVCAALLLALTLVGCGTNPTTPPAPTPDPTATPMVMNTPFPRPTLPPTPEPTHRPTPTPEPPYVLVNAGEYGWGHGSVSEIDVDGRIYISLDELAEAVPFARLA